MVGNNNDSISGSREFTIADDIHLCGFDELDAERFDTLSNHRQNISSFSENVKLKCEGDDVDMVLSFNDIDTSKSGASLDELEQITLFPCEMTNDFLHLRDGSNTKLSAVSKTDNMDNCEPAISSPTQSVICTNTLTQINSLPSIESWTFGTSKSL
ncbi:unnamed protein product [Heterobilharzia americana]|nr:unnamed protein product [Heterobilharzia americana]